MPCPASRLAGPRLASAPAVHPGGHITGFAAGGSDSRVYYPDSEGYITELAWIEGTWIADPIARNVQALRVTVDGSGMTSFAV